MQKDEIINLHKRLATLKTTLNHLDSVDVAPGAFDAYNELDISPSDHHCSKDEHRYAIFKLGEGIAATLNDGDSYTELGELERRMQELASEV